MKRAAGSVVFVGAGPGQADLITVRGAARLRDADVVLFDSLADPALRSLAPQARWIDVGKRGFTGVPHAASGGHENTGQDTINALLVKHASEGKRVVRLKGGDPLVFGRAGEEIAACRAAGVTVEVVPGITAALGAAAMLEASLTHRDHARRLQFVTAHSRHGRLPDDLDWKALADPAATTAIYMGKAVLGEFADKLVGAGLDPDTPAMMVENATRLDQRVFAATVGTMAATLHAHDLDGPCIMLIGHALAEARVVDAAAPSPRLATGPTARPVSA
jgi:uroporphyrin-III C-methyltransferase/precorrin-2 dehydrogenase/sirohydrochlorin ferrochelatase